MTNQGLRRRGADGTTRSRMPVAALVIAAVTVLVATLVGGAAGAERAADPVNLQAIIDEAAPGEVLTLDRELYEGGVVIDKPLTLTGDGWPVVDGGGEGVVVTVEAPDVTVEGLVIRGSGDKLDREDAGISTVDARDFRLLGNRFEDVLFGMFLRTSHGAVIRDNVIGGKDLFIARRGDGIRMWETTGASVEGNVITEGRDSVFWFCDDITVRRNRASGGRYGVHFMYTNGALIEENVLSDNSVGGFLMYSTELVVRNNVFDRNRGPSGYGMGLKDVDGLEATGNRFVGNRVGVFIDNSPGRAGVVHSFENNVFAFNDIGALFRPSVKHNVLSENAFIDNTEQVAIDGSGRLEENEWDADGVGNFWSDFAGYDADGDGVGDMAYHVDDLFSDLTDEYAGVAFFTGTPAARAVDMAGRAFPNLRPDPKITDEAPLVEIPGFPPMPTQDTESSRWALVAVSVVLLAVAVGIVAIALPRRLGRGAPS